MAVRGRRSRFCSSSVCSDSYAPEARRTGVHTEARVFYILYPFSRSPTFLVFSDDNTMRFSLRRDGNIGFTCFHQIQLQFLFQSRCRDAYDIRYLHGHIQAVRAFVFQLMEYCYTAVMPSVTSISPYSISPFLDCNLQPALAHDITLLKHQHVSLTFCNL